MINHSIKKSFKNFFYVRLVKSSRLVNFCIGLVQFNFNDGNSNFYTNGEYLLVKKLNHLIGGLILDIGANVGDWSLMLRKVGYSNEIWAFDPMKKNLDRYDLALKHFGNYKTFQVALSSRAGSQKFFSSLDDSLSGHDSLFDMATVGYFEHTKETTVKTRTLDSYSSLLNNKDVSFIKLDVEGSEIDVLNGSDSVLRSGVSFIQFEFGHAARANKTLLFDLIKLLEKYSFTVCLIKQKSVEKVVYCPSLENQFSCANFLAISNKFSVNDHGAIIAR